jgi:hypothetical protein
MITRWAISNTPCTIGQVVTTSLESLTPVADVGNCQRYRSNHLFAAHVNRLFHPWHRLRHAPFASRNPYRNSTTQFQRSGLHEMDDECNLPVESVYTTDIHHLLAERYTDGWF